VAVDGFRKVMAEAGGELPTAQDRSRVE
jgi:hypothetical protein